MKNLLALDYLEKLISEAKTKKAKYIAIAVLVKGSEDPEIIINSTSNFDKMKDYYKKAYNPDLTLKTNDDIEIIDYTYAESFDCIEYDFLKTLKKGL